MINSLKCRLNKLAALQPSQGPSRIFLEVEGSPMPKDYDAANTEHMLILLVGIAPERPNNDTDQAS